MVDRSGRGKCSLRSAGLTSVYLRKTKRNPRCGLLGILLPNHPNYGMPNRNLNLIRDFPYWQSSGSRGSPNEMMGSYSRSCEACHGAPGGEVWPELSEPQQATEASAFIPQVWYSPALTETNWPAGGED